MKDIVEKYQYYFAETNRLQTIAEEQEKYIAELEAILLEALTDKGIMDTVRKNARRAVIGLGLGAGIGTGVGVTDAMQNKPDPLAGTVFRQSADPGMTGDQLAKVVAGAKEKNKKNKLATKSNEQGTS